MYDLQLILQILTYILCCFKQILLTIELTELEVHVQTIGLFFARRVT